MVFLCGVYIQTLTEREQDRRDEGPAGEDGGAGVPEGAPRRG